MADQKNSPPPSGGPARGGQISDDTAREIIAYQARDLSFRAQELEFRKEELKHYSKYAEAALQAQSKDRSEERQFKQRTTLYRYSFAIAAVIILVAFAFAAMYMNKEQIVLETLKIVGPFVLGFGSGYLYKQAKPDKSQQPRETSSEDESTS